MHRFRMTGSKPERWWARPGQQHCGSTSQSSWHDQSHGCDIFGRWGQKALASCRRSCNDLLQRQRIAGGRIHMQVQVLKHTLRLVSCGSCSCQDKGSHNVSWHQGQPGLWTISCESGNSCRQTMATSLASPPFQKERCNVFRLSSCNQSRPESGQQTTSH